MFLFKITSPLDRFHESQFAEKGNRANTENILQNSELEVGQLLAPHGEPLVEDMVRVLGAQLVQVEDVLARVAEGSEELLLLPGLAALRLLLLECDHNLAIGWQGIRQPGAPILVLIHEKYFQVVKENNDRMGDRCQAQNLLKYSKVLLFFNIYRSI